MSVYRSDDSITDENLVHTDLADEFNQAPEKAVPADDDRLLIESAANNGYKRFLTFSNLKAFIKQGFTLAWGSLTGNLSDQADLQAALDAKVEQVNNVGTGYSLVQPKIGQIVPIKAVSASAGVSITDTGDTLFIGANPGGIDHGQLAGLGDDDHPQYLTEARGDARYSQTAHTHQIGDVAGLQNELDSKASLVHAHTIPQVTGLQGVLDTKIETVSNTGPGAAIALPKNGTDVPLKTLVAGPNVIISEQANTITIESTGGGGGGGSIPHQITGTAPVNVLVGDTAFETFSAQQIFGGLRLEVALSGAQYKTSMTANGIEVKDQTGTTTYTRLTESLISLDEGTQNEIRLSAGEVRVGQASSPLRVGKNYISGITSYTGADSAVPRSYVDNGLSGKANTNHTHAISDVTNLQGFLDNKLEQVVSGGVTGVGLTMPKQGTSGRVKNLVAGANITLTDNGDNVVIESAAAGGGTLPNEVLRVAFNGMSIGTTESPISFGGSDGSCQGVAYIGGATPRFDISEDGMYSFDMGAHMQGAAEAVIVRVYVDGFLTETRLFCPQAGTNANGYAHFILPLVNGNQVTFRIMGWTGGGRTIRAGETSRLRITRIR